MLKNAATDRLPAAKVWGSVLGQAINISSICSAAVTVRQCYVFRAVENIFLNVQPWQSHSDSRAAVVLLTLTDSKLYLARHGGEL